MGIFDKFTKKTDNEENNAVQEPVQAQRNNDYAVGLDIGTTKIVAFAGKRNRYGDVEILGHEIHESIGVLRGQVFNITDTSNAINYVINKLNSQLKAPVTSVMVGIAGQHIHSQRIYGDIKRNHTDSVISQDDIDHLLEEMFKTPLDPGKQVLDVIPQEYVIDGDNRTDKPVGVMGKKIGSEFNIIIGDVNHIRNIGRCVKNCNLNMDSLILEPIASAEVVLDQDEKDVGVALVDIGGGTTDVVVFSKGIMRHSAVIPIASGVITEDIFSVFDGITRQQAESLKIHHGSCLPDDATQNHKITIPGIHGRDPKEVSELELAKVIHARMTEIIDRVIQELTNAKCMEMLGCGIVFTGGGSKLKGLKELAELKIGKSVRIGNPEEKIKISNTDYKNPSFSTGLGLMLLGVERNEALYGYTPSPSNEEELPEEDEYMEEEYEAEETESPKKTIRPKWTARKSEKDENKKPWVWGAMDTLMKKLLTEPDDFNDDDDFDDDDDKE